MGVAGAGQSTPVAEIPEPERPWVYGVAMSSGGFGPEGPGVSDAPPFAVAGPSELAVDGSRAGTGSFTVSNVTGRAVRARVLVTPGAGADAGWFAVVGSAERALPDAGTATVQVAVTVPPAAAAGSYTFVVGAALEESPDRVVSGSTVTFAVPEAAKRPFPWWIVIVAAAVLALAGAAIWWFTRPDEGEPTPTDDGAAVFREGVLTLPSGDGYIDLDEGVVLDPGLGSTGNGEDIYFYPGAGSGELGLVGQGPPRVAVVDEATFAACESATGYDDLEAQNVLVLANQTVHICVRFTDQGRLAVMTIELDEAGTHSVAFTTWERGE